MKTIKRPVFFLTAIAAVVIAGCDAKAPVAVVPPVATADAQAPADVQAAAAPPVTALAPAPVTAITRAPVSSRTSNSASPSSAQYSYVPPAAQVGDEEEYGPPPIYAAYEPPISQPPPIAVPWAPPPMLVESPPPPPSPDARWTGGYWVWHDRWAWAPGRWAEPPRPQYHWVPPYYEHRRDRVVFVDGFWSPPNV
ncbi:MAG: hypothetical protein M3Y55_07090, partial [Pseudomonadota bacterium]|nr:hypothetical protein [Pseudomonadota bacterium]